MSAVGEDAVPEFLGEEVSGTFGEPGVFFFGGVPFDPAGAAGVQLAAHIKVTLVDNVLAAEVVNHDGAVFGHQNVVVPGHAGGVEEDGHVGELVVVLENVFQIDHCFTAFVAVEVERGVGVVNNVDGFVGDILESVMDPCDASWISIKATYNNGGAVVGWT